MDISNLLISTYNNEVYCGNYSQHLRLYAVNGQPIFLFVRQLFDVIQTFFHHHTIGVFVKQACKFFPWIPFQVKIHIPLKRQWINLCMIVNPPSINYFWFVSLLKMHYDLRIVLIFLNNMNSRKFWCGIVWYKSRMPKFPVRSIIDQFKNGILFSMNIDRFRYADMRRNEEWNCSHHYKKKNNTY